MNEWMNEWASRKQNASYSLDELLCCFSFFFLDDVDANNRRQTNGATTFWCKFSHGCFCWESLFGIGQWTSRLPALHLTSSSFLFCFLICFFFHLFCFLFVFRITNMCPPPKECLKNTGKRRYDSSCCHYSFGYLFFSWVFEDGESSNDIIINKTFTLWSKTAKNTDWSTGPLACPFAHSLTPSLLGQWIIGWLFCLCFLLFSTIVKSRGRCQGFWFMEMGLWWYWQV